MSEFDNVLSSFIDLSGSAVTNLSGMMALIEGGIAPTDKQRDDLVDLLGRLRGSYERLKAIARVQLGDMVIDEEDLSASHYKEQLDELRSQAFRREVERTQVLLTKFIGVGARNPFYQDALAPAQETARATLETLQDALDEYRSDDGSLDIDVSGPRDFMLALEMQDIDSEEGAVLIKRINGSMSMEVVMGLMTKSYFVREPNTIPSRTSDDTAGDCSDTIPLMGESAEDGPSVEDDLDGRRNDDSVSKTDADTEPSSPLDETPIKPVRAVKANAKLGVKQIENKLLAKASRMGTGTTNVMSVLMRFGACTNSQVVSLCRLITGEHGAIDAEDVKRSIESLERASVACTFVVDGVSVYCITKAGQRVLMRDTIRTRRSVYDKEPFWSLPFEEHECRADLTMLPDTLRRVVKENDDLLERFLRIKREKGSHKALAAIRGTHRVDGAYIIDFDDDEADSNTDLTSGLDDEVPTALTPYDDGNEYADDTASDGAESIVGESIDRGDATDFDEPKDASDAFKEHGDVIDDGDVGPCGYSCVSDIPGETEQVDAAVSAAEQDSSQPYAVVNVQRGEEGEGNGDSTEAPRLRCAPRSPELASESAVDAVVLLDEMPRQSESDDGLNAEEVRDMDAMSMEQPSAERVNEIVEGILGGTFGMWTDSSFSDRVGVALTFAKAIVLSDSSGEGEGAFRRLLMATDSGIAAYQYTLDQIRDAFADPSQSEVGQALLLSTYLRAMLNPANPYDYDLWGAFDFYADKYDDYFGAFPECKALFTEMRGIHTISEEHGFTAGVIDRLSERARNRDRLQEICALARDLTTVRKVKNQIKGVHEFHEAAFGSRSELGMAMAAVADNDEGALPSVSELVHRFAGDDLLASSPNMEAIEADITQTWRDKVVPRINTRMHKGNRDLGFDARNTARDEYTKRIEVMCAWVSYKDSHAPDEVLKAMGEKRLKIISACDHALSLLSNTGSRKGAEFLSWTIEDISGKLQGTSASSVSYVDFLRTGFISLADDMTPLFAETEGKVAHFEPWRRVLAHVQQRDVSLQEAYARLQSPECLGDNLRQAQQLRIVLGMDPLGGREFERAIELASKDADAKLSSLKDDLEIWYAYGRIDDDQRETLAAMADDLREPMYETGNFDLWQMMLSALRKTADDWSSVQYRELQARCASARSQLHGSEESPLLEEAKKLLEDERNYAVVEDYLNRFESGERDLTRQDVNDEEDEFVRFMSDEVFQPIYERAVSGKASTNTFKRAAKRFVDERHSEDWTAEQFESSYKLIASWPSNKGYGTTQLRDLFLGMGFDATYGEKVKATDTNAEHYRVHLTPKARNLQSYSHPIAVFGTQAVESIDVVVAYENASPQTVVQLVSSLRANEAVAVLVDYHLDRASRRKVAELYMKMAARPTKFLLVDRVLLMHLAQAQLSERLAMLLKCTLPLTFLQPFTNGAGPTADEMFCGRVVELDKIMSFNGTCIIYGGRQLGKTALLERAASLVNDPGNRQLAVKVSIKGLADEQTVVRKIVQELNKELRKVKKSLSLERRSTMSELRQELDELFESRTISRLLLLLDETDYFLAAIASDEYAQLEPLDELRMRWPGSFKFVLAGLHNVVRATRNTKNVIFGRLGEPVCIKPLPPRDALRLLRRPLLYLGYHVDYPNIETILTNTNYYPGLVQFFGNKLVESMSTHFGVFYSAARSNPPYLLKEQQLANIFTDYDINVAIREKFMLTLELDERDRYMLIAQIIAALYYERKKAGRPTNEGFTLQEIKGFADEWHFSKLALETADTFMALLDELCEMGVLAHVGAERDHYRIRRSTFLGYIGSEEGIWDAFAEEEFDEG